jgi:hypothetical protein
MCESIAGLAGEGRPGRDGFLIAAYEVSRPFNVVRVFKKKSSLFPLIGWKKLHVRLMPRCYFSTEILGVPGLFI